jgi:pimeloyl-ACP methyl ester carboxylesterase
MTATTTTSGLIQAGTTKLYHEVRGSGPALLITGGTGDAGEWTHLAPTLAEACTVVTYDRRGMSRSPRPDGWTATSMPEAADDAAALLRALDLAPAVVVGHSGGASVACSLVARHPEVVRHAVLYEPPLLAVVPQGQQIVAGMRAVIEQAMAEGGPRRAMEAFIRGNAGGATRATRSPTSGSSRSTPPGVTASWTTARCSSRSSCRRSQRSCPTGRACRPAGCR